MSQNQHINLNFDNIRRVAQKGVRRTSVFMGLGLNAAFDDKVRDYDLTNITQIQIIPPNVDESTLVHFKEEFGRWIITCGVRELIETYSVFLDRIYNACLLIGMYQQKVLSLHDGRKKLKTFLRHGLGEKLNLLEFEYDISTCNKSHLASINQARNCLAHRRGVVGLRDCAEGNELSVKWMGWDLYVETPSGQKILLTPSKPSEDIILKEGGTVKYKYSERMRSFNIGTPITLTPKDLAEICYMTLRSSNEVCKKGIRYAQEAGVPKNEQ